MYTTYRLVNVAQYPTGPRRTIYAPGSLVQTLVRLDDLRHHYDDAVRPLRWSDASSFGYEEGGVPRMWFIEPVA